MSQVKYLNESLSLSFLLHTLSPHTLTLFILFPCVFFFSPFLPSDSLPPPPPCLPSVVLQGSELHWLACALYVACRSSVPTVGKGTSEGNYVSLTRILRCSEMRWAHNAPVHSPAGLLLCSLRGHVTDGGRRAGSTARQLTC